VRPLPVDTDRPGGNHDGHRPHRPHRARWRDTEGHRAAMNRGTGRKSGGRVGEFSDTVEEW
jgi:hypothetical protein